MTRLEELKGGSSSSSGSYSAPTVDSCIVDEDAILQEIGRFGRFQKMYSVWVMGLTWLFCGGQTLLMVFASYEPVRYKVCLSSPASSSEIPSSSTSSPLTPTAHEGTRQVLLASQAGEDEGPTVRVLLPMMSCGEDDIPLSNDDCATPYRYLNEGLSIVSEWKLGACSATTGSAEMSCSAFFLGFMLGVSLLGHLSDASGRRRALMVSWWVMSVSSFLSAVSPDIWTYSLLRCLTGVGVGGSGMACYVLAAEIVTADYRPLATAIHGAFFAAGAVSVAALALLLTSWRLLTLLSAIVPALAFALFSRCGRSPLNIESPRWLLSQGKRWEALNTWQRIATTNTGHALRALHVAQFLQSHPASPLSSKLDDIGIHRSPTTSPASSATRERSPIGCQFVSFEHPKSPTCSDTVSAQNKEQPAGMVTDVLSSSSSSSSSTIAAQQIASPPSLGQLGRGDLASGASSESLRTVLLTPPFQAWFIIMTALWFACSLLYYGVSLYASHSNATNNDADGVSSPPTFVSTKKPVADGHQSPTPSLDEGLQQVALTTFVSFIIEIPVLFTAVVLADTPIIGRKGVVAVGCLLAGFALILSYALHPYTSRAAANAVAAVGRLLVSGSFAVLYLYSAELFPTSVRGVSTGALSMAARIAGILAPFVVSTLDLWRKYSPMLVFGLMSLFAGAVGWYVLPETLNGRLYNSLKQQREEIQNSVRNSAASPETASEELMAAAPGERDGPRALLTAGGGDAGGVLKESHSSAETVQNEREEEEEQGGEEMLRVVIGRAHPRHRRRGDSAAKYAQLDSPSNASESSLSYLGSDHNSCSPAAAALSPQGQSVQSVSGF